MPPPPRMKKEKLVAFSGEHLYYEIWMLYTVTDKLHLGVSEPCVYNALLESFVVHASIILDFFYKPQSKPDDAKAIHYLNSVEQWNAILPSYAKYFRKFNQKRNKEVIHLSYKRLDVALHQKQWGTRDLVTHIKHLVNEFLELANPEYLDPKIYELRSYPS